MKKYLALMVILGFLFMNVPSAKAVTMGELETQVKSLLQEVKDLRAQLAQRVLGESTVSVDAITKPLSVGVRSKDVQALQEFLKTEGDLKIATPTNYFGPLTRDAVKSFQARNSLSVTGRISSADLTRIRTLNESRNLTSPVAGCTASTAPFITVVAPNGGEIYPAGAQVTVRWKSCNVGNIIAIILEHYNTNNVLDGGINMTPLNTVNDGSEVVVLPTSIQTPNSNYKIVIVDQQVIPNLPESTHDYSDNFFTINASTVAQCSISATVNGIEGIGLGVTSSQYIATGNTTGISDAAGLNYSFVTSSSNCSSPVTITKLQFVVSNNSVTSLKIGSTSVPVVNGQAVFNNLNLVVNNDTNPNITNQEVSISYPPVGVSTSSVASGTESQIKLNSLDFMDSIGMTHTQSLSVLSPKMMLVGSKPDVTLYQSTSILTVGTTEIMNTTVNANVSGSIKLNSLPISVTVGGATISGLANSIIVRDGSNNIIPTTNTALSSNGGNSIITFTGGLNISTGFSSLLRVYVPVVSVGSSSGAFISTQLGSSSNFSWIDVAGGNSTPFTIQNTTYLYNYPTNSSTINN